MQGTERLSPSPEAPPPGNVSVKQLDDLADDFRLGFANSARKSEPGEEAVPGPRIPFEMIEELDQAWRSLSGTVDLALAVADARRRAETASISLDGMMPGSVAEVSASQWRDLIKQLQGLSSLARSPSADLSQRLQGSVERFRRARDGADEEAHSVSRQLHGSAAGQPDPDRLVAVSDAVAELCIALTECAEACDSERKKHLEGIGYCVRWLFEQPDWKLAGGAKPVGGKEPQAGDGARSEQGSTASERKLAASSNGGDQESRNEGSGRNGLERSGWA